MLLFAAVYRMTADQYSALALIFIRDDCLFPLTPITPAEEEEEELVHFTEVGATSRLRSECCYRDQTGDQNTAKKTPKKLHLHTSE